MRAEPGAGRVPGSPAPRQRLRDPGHHRLRLLRKLLPRDPDHAHAPGREHEIAATVVLEDVSGGMEGVAVDLDDEARFAAGEIDLRIQVERGSIRGIRIFGDFMSRRDVAELEAGLVGVRYDRDGLTEAMARVDVQDYFADLADEAFIALLVD